MQFEFATATRIIFGPGTAGQLPALAAHMGRRAFILTGSDPARLSAVVGAVHAQGLEGQTHPITGEPDVETISRAVAKARAMDCDVVVGIGGGSVLDAAKAVAAMLANPGELLDYLEVVGAGWPITEAPIPCIAVPTTAGTGAEVTRNAVIAVPDSKVKVSMRSLLMLPRLALVDPLLTVSMSAAVTASTGLDALTQLIEAYTSKKANPLTDGICTEGIRRAARSLALAYKRPDDLVAREDMALASLFGGLALANAALGAVHGFAGPLGGMIGAPHGVICGRLLPHVMASNVLTLQTSHADSDALARYDNLAAMLTGDSSATADDAVRWIHDLVGRLCIPSLTGFGLTTDLIPQAVIQAQRASSMKGNPVALGEGQLTQILQDSM